MASVNEVEESMIYLRQDRDAGREGLEIAQYHVCSPMILIDYFLAVTCQLLGDFPTLRIPYFHYKQDDFFTQGCRTTLAC